MDHHTASLGSVIRGRIEAAGYTVRSAALAAGIPHSTLDRKLRTSDQFTFSELARIADLLGVRVSELAEAAEQVAS